MNFIDLIWELPNALPNDLCDDLVNFFEEREDLQYQGVTAGGVQKDVKDSIDLKMTSDECPELDEKLFQVITKNNVDYVRMIAAALWPSDQQYFVTEKAMTDSGYQIQKTTKDGFYRWHNDYDGAPVLDTIPAIETPSLEGKWPMVGVNERLYTFLYYLTDGIEGGRTQFYFNGEIHSVVPQKGKGLWFPANSLYTHRGEPVISGEKYIVTGWIYEPNLRRAQGSYGNSKKVREGFGEECMVFKEDDQGILTHRPV